MPKEAAEAVCSPALQQPHPRDNVAHVNYPPCLGKAAGVGQRRVHLFRVGREHPSSQPQC